MISSHKGAEKEYMYVVITGASRGIGKALAYKFAEHNYDLLLTCDKNIDLLNEVKTDIEKKYAKKVIAVKGEISENDLPNDIYILINNAGKCDYNLIQDISYEKYKEIVYSNLDYTFLTTKLVSRQMIKNKQGIIVNISSIWGILGASLESIYSMTKGGINAFTKSLAKELKDSNVDVIAFALGAVDTDMNRHLSDEERKDFVKTLDGGRMLTIEEVAEKIHNIVTTKSYNTGDIIELNNGLS